MAVGVVDGSKRGNSFLSLMRHHVLKQNITCETTRIIYLINFQCGAFYTRRQLKQRMLDHLYDIEMGKLDNPLCRHVGLKHQYNLMSLRAESLSTSSNPPGGWDAHILQQECRWIFLLKAMEAPGLMRLFPLNLSYSFCLRRVTPMGSAHSLICSILYLWCFLFSVFLSVYELCFWCCFSCFCCHLYLVLGRS